jgi:hypothetical protein
MAWVKLHDDILGDPKLMRAARRGSADLIVLPWLIAFANMAGDGGRLSVGGSAADPDDIAYQIPGATAEQVGRALNSLEGIGVLTEDPDGCLRFAKWDHRQSKPSNSKEAIRERVTKHRNAKRRNASASNTPSALQGVTGVWNGVASMPGEGAVTPCNATEQKRGEEKRREKEENPADAGAGKPPAVTKIRPPRAPAPWMGAMQAAWSFGTLPPGSATLLQPVVAAVGPEEAASRLAAYCERTESGFASLRSFVSKHASFASGSSGARNGDKPRVLAATESLFT